MKRIVQLNIRIDALIDASIDKFCSKLNMTRSSFVYAAIVFYLKDKGYKKLEKELTIDIQRQKIREQNHQLYLIKNTFMTIINMAKMDLIQHTQVNLKKIDLEVKECKKLYVNFPPKIKKLLKDDIKQLENLKYRNNIMLYMNNWDLVQEFLGIRKPMKPMKRLELK